jgi:diacylglycerol kinase family enzyme
MYVGVVVNPHARKNRSNAAERVGELRRILGSSGEVHETASVDDLRSVVAGLDERVTHVVCDGGDGSLHWLINEMRSHLGDPARWPVFVPTNGGTIDFVARKAQVRGHVHAIVAALASAATANRPPPQMQLDSLELRGNYADATPFVRVGFAVAAGGVGNRFFDLYYRDRDPGRSAIVRVIAKVVSDYAVGAFRQHTRENDYAAQLFNPTQALVTIDGEAVATRTHTALHAGAIDVNLGGLLRLFPKAKEPGALHFQAGELSPATVVAQLPALVAGRAVRGERFRDVRGREMTIEAVGEPLAPIVDGERFHGVERLGLRAGPRIRVARLG